MLQQLNYLVKSQLFIQLPVIFTIIIMWFSVHIDLFSSAAEQELSAKHQRHDQYLVMKKHHFLIYNFILLELLSINIKKWD